MNPLYKAPYMNPPIQDPNMNTYKFTLGYDTHTYHRDYIHNSIGYRDDVDTLASDLETTFLFTYRAANLEDALMGAMTDVLEALPSAVLIHVKT